MFLSLLGILIYIYLFSAIIIYLSFAVFQLHVSLSMTGQTFHEDVRRNEECI